MTDSESGKGVLGPSGVSERFNLDNEARPLLPDFTEVASVESPLLSPLGSPAIEPLGLPVLEPGKELGILDRRAPLSDLAESFVSALLNEGYDSRSLNLRSEDRLALGVEVPELFCDLEG